MTFRAFICFYYNPALDNGFQINMYLAILFRIIIPIVDIPGIQNP
jgi:hypothetical protein